jgi:hypothetical protein
MMSFKDYIRSGDGRSKDRSVADEEGNGDDGDGDKRSLVDYCRKKSRSDSAKILAYILK